MNAFVLDFDGPIFDGRGYAQEALDETINQFQTKYGKPKLRFSGLPLLDPRRLIDMMYAELKLERADLNIIEDFYSELLLVKEINGEINPEVKTIIKKMHNMGVKMAVFSARPIASLEKILKKNAFQDCFELVVGEGTVLYGKPAPDGLILIANNFNIEPTQLVFIGDSIIDFQAAKACGAIYYHAGWTGEPSNCIFSPRTIISKPSDLQELISSGIELIQTITPVIPNTLENIIRKNEFSFYTGAGISVNSGIGGWQDHYLPVLDSLNAGMLASDPNLELEDTLQLLAVKDAKAVFDKFKESFLKNEAKPNGYHYSILRSSAENIWTTNYDHLFETANNEGKFERGIITNDDILLNNFTHKRCVFKMNGDFEGAIWNKDLDWELVFLREQFDTVEEKRREIWRALEDDYRNKCIVFVGLSFTDSALRRIISIQRRKIKRTRHPHFFLTKSSKDPLESRKAMLHAKNLERININTLFFDSYKEIEDFVGLISLSSIQPVIAFSGDTDTNLNPSDFLPNGAINLEEISQFCSNLAKELVSSKSYHISSGGAPGVGIPSVSSAFKANPSLARFYLRQRSSRKFSRIAPAIIVEGDNYCDMRKRFIGEAHFLVALGGREVENSGVIEEVNMALEKSIPIIIIPQAGGAIYGLNQTFKQKIAENYKDERLRNALYQANEEIAMVAPKDIEEFTISKLPMIIEKLLLIYVASGASYKPSPNGW